ncbi:MAG: hypothetical protein JXA36_00020 [Coriobacteriia bacterium]|nr:hypothetical protein [Coriobacteriia bacterium]
MPRFRVRWIAYLTHSLLVLVLLAGCGGDTATPQADAGSASTRLVLPEADGSWSPVDTMVGGLPSAKGTVEIRGIGKYAFEASAVRTARPDIFAEGHFSLFDVLVHVHEQGQIALEYHYEPLMETHVVDSIDGEPFWWYQAHYSSGWFETSAFRMDHYLWKDGTVLRVEHVSEERLAQLHSSFADEVARRASNGGEVIVPEVVIRDRNSSRTFRDVAVIPHDLRSDVLQPGVVTALDILLSLGERGDLSLLELSWYETINRADPVDSYFIERIDESEAYGRCGYVYEVGADEFSGSRGSHIHIPTDVRIVVSPDYAMWFWLCL